MARSNVRFCRSSALAQRGGVLESTLRISHGMPEVSLAWCRVKRARQCQVVNAHYLQMGAVAQGRNLEFSWRPVRSLAVPHPRHRTWLGIGRRVSSPAGQERLPVLILRGRWMPDGTARRAPARLADLRKASGLPPRHLGAGESKNSTCEARSRGCPSFASAPAPSASESLRAVEAKRQHARHPCPDRC